MKNKNIKSLLFIVAMSSFLFTSSNAAVVLNDEEGSENKPKLERHFVFDTIPLNLEEITKDAEKIFAGKCIEVKEIDHDKKSNLPVVRYTFKVTEKIKGLGDASQVVFKQWKPTVNNAGYELGKNYFLFLYPESEKGLTSPVGFLQGQFEIESKGFFRRNKVVKNKTSNRGLYKNLRNKKSIALKKSKYINDYVSRCSELGIPIRYQEFVEAVKELSEN